jgi:hypothetical protein
MIVSPAVPAPPATALPLPMVAPVSVSPDSDTAAVFEQESRSVMQTGRGDFHGSSAERGWNLHERHGGADYPGEINVESGANRVTRETSSLSSSDRKLIDSYNVRNSNQSLMMRQLLELDL